MIRVYALGMGVATIRLFIGLFTALWQYRFEDVFGTAFWLGFSVNLLVAETWINTSRATRPSGRRQATSEPVANARS